MLPQVVDRESEKGFHLQTQGQAGGRGVEMMVPVGFPRLGDFPPRGREKTQFCKLVPLTIDLGNRRLGVQLSNSLCEPLWKPLLEGKVSVKGLRQRRLPSFLAQTGLSTSAPRNPFHPSVSSQNHLFCEAFLDSLPLAPTTSPLLSASSPDVHSLHLACVRQGRACACLFSGL